MSLKWFIQRRKDPSLWYQEVYIGQQGKTVDGEEREEFKLVYLTLLVFNSIFICNIFFSPHQLEDLIC